MAKGDIPKVDGKSQKRKCQLTDREQQEAEEDTEGVVGGSRTQQLQRARRCLRKPESQ